MANRAQLYKYRGNQCAHCGMHVEEMVARYDTFNRMFEFHHVEPHEKHQEYTKLMERTISSDQIEEVDKCVLLCRECHGIVHAQDQKGSLTLHVNVGNREVSQKLNGWFVIDHVDKNLKFISNERNLLQSCVVKLGTESEQKYCILELMQDDRMLKWLQDIETHKRIEIRSINRKRIMLEVEHENGNRVDVRMILGIPIFAMDFDVSEGSSSYVWLRNGIVLTKEGEIISEGEVCFPVDLNV